MTVLLDIEGEPIPLDGIERPMFDADFYDWNDGRGPILIIKVPFYFETAYGAYNGHGVVQAPIKDIFEEYLQYLDYQDGGLGADVFAEWLHEYADKLKAAKAKINKQLVENKL